MKQKLFAFFCIIVLLLCSVGCGADESTTTVSGMIVSVEGTVITLRKMGGQMQGNFGGNRAERDENGDFKGFDRENMPEGFNPENMPEGFDPENLPEGMKRPNRQNGEDFQRPTGEDAQRPTGKRPDFKQFANGEGAETETYDLANAHISLKVDEGQASGTMDDIKQGSIVTLTLNKKGEVVQILVTATSGFGGRGQGMGGFGGFGGNGKRGEQENKTTQEDTRQNTQENT